MKRLPLLVASLVLAGCNLSTDVESHPSDPTTEIFAAGLQVDLATMTKTTLGIYYRDLKPGDGQPLVGTPNVLISYQEFLKDGFVVGAVVNVPQALAGMIPGIRDGMQGMKPGGERLMVIPSALAYGNSPGVPGVPPNSTLVVDMVFNSYVVQ